MGPFENHWQPQPTEAATNEALVKAVHHAMGKPDEPTDPEAVRLATEIKAHPYEDGILNQMFRDSFGGKGDYSTLLKLGADVEHELKNSGIDISVGLINEDCNPRKYQQVYVSLTNDHRTERFPVGFHRIDVCGFPEAPRDEHLRAPINDRIR